MGQEEARDEGSTPVKERSPDPVVGVAGSGSAEDAEVPVHSLLPATEGTAEVHTGDANAVGKMASYTTFQYNILVIDIDNTTLTNMIVKDDHSQAFRFK